MGLKPAKIQPTIFKEPSVGEDTVLARKLAKQQRAAAEGTGVRLPAAPKVVAEEKAAERALAPKIEKITPVKEEQGYLGNVVSSLNKGFYKNLVGNPLQGLSTFIKYGTSAMTGGRVKEGFLTDQLDKFSSWYNNAIDEVSPQDQDFKNSLSDQFVQAFGQVISTVTTAGVGVGGRAVSLAEQAIPRVAAGRVAEAPPVATATPVAELESTPAEGTINTSLVDTSDVNVTVFATPATPLHAAPFVA